MDILGRARKDRLADKKKTPPAGDVFFRSSADLRVLSIRFLAGYLSFAQHKR